MSKPGIGDQITTPSGASGRVFATLDDPSGTYVKLGTFASDWELAPADSVAQAAVVAPDPAPVPVKQKSQPPAPDLPAAPVASS